MRYPFVRETIVCTCLLLAALAPGARAATFVVTSTAPTWDGVCDADCTLIDAILEAEAAAGPDVIRLQNCATYTYPTSYSAVTALPDITTTITFEGNGAVIERDPGAADFRIMFLEETAEVTLENLTVRNGRSPFMGAGIFNFGGVLTISNCIIENNASLGTLSAFFGGGVYNRHGTLNMDHTTVRNNSAVRGAGLASDGYGDPLMPSFVTIRNSSFVDNHAMTWGSFNGFAGGMLLRGEQDVLIQDTTVSGNLSDEEGAGIYFQSVPEIWSLELRNVTVTDNEALNGSGGGLYVKVCGAICPIATSPVIDNSIIADNFASTAATDWLGDYTSAGNNIIGQGSGSFPPTASDQVVVTLGSLSPLITSGDAGGEHHRPLPGSIAISAGDPAKCLPEDQIDLSRVGTCETGAIEFRDCVVPPGGIVDWWPFDETVGTASLDVAGSVANDGTRVNSPTPSPGVVQGGLCFDGVDQSVIVPDDDEIDFLGDCSGSTEELTIDAWVKTCADGWQPIVDKRESGADFLRGYQLYILDGRLGFQMATGPGSSTCGVAGSACDDYVSPPPGPGDVDLRDNRWHFVAVTMEPCGVGPGRMYIDGTLVHTFTPRIGDISNAADLLIGERHPVPSTINFQGCIDELEFFKRALSPAELDSIHDAGWAGKCSLTCDESDIAVCDGLCPLGERCVAGDTACACEPLPCQTSPFPECEGPCPPGEFCHHGQQTCECLPLTTCETSATPECGGDCPAGQVCDHDTALDECFCKDAVPCIDAELPVCDGLCPENEECMPGANECSCEPVVPCSDLSPPQCNGVCPDGETCKQIQSDCVCVPDPVLCQDAGEPECEGSCPPDQTCKPSGDPAEPCVCVLCATVGPDPNINVVSVGPSTWVGTPLTCATKYNTYRAEEARFVDSDRDGAADDYGVCYLADLVAPEFEDTSVPSAGRYNGYLVTGENPNGEGSLGNASSGAPRPNRNPCP